MPANLLSPWTVAIAIVLILLIALIVSPGLAANVSRGFIAAKELLFSIAKRMVGFIRSYWSLEGRKEKEQDLFNKQIQPEIKQREQEEREEKAQTAQMGQGRVVTLTAEDKKRIRAEVVEDNGGGPKPPTSYDQVTAWATRFVYIVLVLVCVASDYVFTSSRAPIVIGGSAAPPAWLTAAFQYLSVITGVLFVSVAALSGMLIDEFVGSHSRYVKIWPDLSPILKYTGLALAISMFVIDVIAVIFLALAGYATEFQQSMPAYTVLVVLLGIVVVIALGVLLAFPGLWQGFAALASLVILGAIALFCFLAGMLCLIISGLLETLAELNYRITGRSKQGPQQAEVTVDTRNLAVVGYGLVGSTWAVNVCREYGQLYGPNIWLAGTNESGQEHLRERNKALALVRATNISPRASQPNSSGSLVSNLTMNYRSKRQDEVKPLLWIAKDEELDKCLDDLQDMSLNQDLKNIKLVILWIVSPGASQNAKILNLAADLKAWASKDSILTTTLVFETEAPVKDWGEPRDRILLRSLVALLGAGINAPDNSFVGAITDLNKAGYPFGYLAVGSVGVDPTQENYNDGFISGKAGEFNPLDASQRVRILAADVLGAQKYSTVTIEEAAKNKKPDNTDAMRLAVWQRQQGLVFVNVVVPAAQRLKHWNQFKAKICEWLRSDYGVYEQHVAVVPGIKKDNGINISAAREGLKGDYYFQLTVLRGVGTGDMAIPQDLSQGTANSNREAKLGAMKDRAVLVGRHA